MSPDPEGRHVLWGGVVEWGGPASCAKGMAVAMGIQSAADLLEWPQRAPTSPSAVT